MEFASGSFLPAKYAKGREMKNLFFSRPFAYFAGPFFWRTVNSPAKIFPA
jgi:hypothetical protein